MKNLSKINCPCWVENDLSDEAAYEIYIFLSSLAWNFLNHYHDQIDQHENAVSFWEENNLTAPNINIKDDELPF